MNIFQINLKEIVVIRYLGYACVNEHLKPKTFKTCRLASIEKYGLDYLRERILHNIDLTYEILQWNVKNGIYLYRMSSDLMPLITHPLILDNYDWRWYLDQEILYKLDLIKTYVIKHDLRLSMHPDQFTVLNSDKAHVVKNSIDYLDYHQRLLESVGGHDIILHVGGVYGDKKNAIKRFILAFKALEPKIKGYIRLENDDKSYHIHDVIKISQETDIPIIFDIHHHMCYQQKPVGSQDLKDIVDSWKGKIPKVHISSGRTGMKDRSHHDFIRYKDFEVLDNLFRDYKIDVMVEAKKKEKAVIKLLEEIHEAF